MIRHFYSLSLLFLLVANTIGGICILNIHHHHIKEYVESILRNGNIEVSLEKIVIPANQSDQLIWLKENKEFRCKGKMYDVICTEYKKDTIIYHCINDKKEEDLIREIANNDQHPFPGQHQDSRIILQFLKIISGIAISPPATSAVVFDEKLNPFCSCAYNILPVYLSLSGEPPDSV